MYGYGYTTVTATSTINRIVNGEDTDLEIEITGWYAGGELEDFEIELVDPIEGFDLKLNEIEEFRCLDALKEESYYG